MGSGSARRSRSARGVAVGLGDGLASGVPLGGADGLADAPAGDSGSSRRSPEPRPTTLRRRPTAPGVAAGLGVGRWVPGDDRDDDDRAAGRRGARLDDRGLLRLRVEDDRAGLRVSETTAWAPASSGAQPGTVTGPCGQTASTLAMFTVYEPSAPGAAQRRRPAGPRCGVGADHSARAGTRSSR